jgi:hypothetical protein
MFAAMFSQILSQVFSQIFSPVFSLRLCVSAFNLFFDFIPVPVDANRTKCRAILVGVPGTQRRRETQPRIYPARIR